ncbi:ComEC/Rec2 family competence protein [Paenarthrobacter nicotinovorans]|uniref:ComEC/Rec2 family competence protein n=1 Tax=Paenarthrobacter nicotinovorans TaxID=29320 RepID=UPI0007E7618E|nr:ComEC/Rec2 family competence protein [Paenarthrobacter nicotinovorans]
MAEPGVKTGPAKRTDLRLVPAVATAWGAALVGSFNGALWSWVLAGVLAIAGAVLMIGGRRLQPAGARARTLPATFALACFMGASVAVHCAAVATQRDDGPLAHAVAEKDGVVIQLLITGNPTEAAIPGHAGGSRWTVTAAMQEVTSNSTLTRGAADVLVTGSEAWKDVQPGQLVRTTGILKEVRDGQAQAAVLSASSAPVLLDTQFDIRQQAGVLKQAFGDATHWLPPDAAGLLRGMVTGDTSALPESLEADMKTTGMTHLTAVSGSNCSLVLGGFIVLARSFRLSRPLAGAFGACGLAGFVVMVGPDPSVLRASVMGAVGLAAMVGGLRGRSLTFLCVATALLLLLDPAMSANVGFLLSVLATLGIVLLACRVASWIPSRVPRWIAAGLAVPLSAQLLCGPVIVALQPQFTPYAFIANVVAGPLVAPVTIFGTVAVPLTAFAPWLATVPVAVAGGCAAAVAGLARFFAGLPGAALPWADGPVGVASMLAFSAIAVLMTWGMLHPGGFLLAVLAFHGRIMKGLECLERRVPRRANPWGAIRRQRRTHGRPKPCTKPSGRNHQWLLPKTHVPRTSGQTTPGGVTPRPPL